MTPKIYIAKIGKITEGELIEIQGDYDIVVTCPADTSQDRIDEFVNHAKLKFIELSERARVKPTGVHPIPQNASRPKRKRIVR